MCTVEGVEFKLNIVKIVVVVVASNDEDRMEAFGAVQN